MSEEDAKKNVHWVDPSKRAAQVLDTILDSDLHKESILDSFDEDSVSKTKDQRLVEEEKVAPRILDTDTGRDAARVVFVTRDTSLLTPKSLAQQHFMELCSVFDEVHVIVLAMRKDSSADILRVGERMWVYPTHSKYWWRRAHDALKLAEAQLTFADGFRPDAVVALDPFESGVAGYWIADKYERAFQVHVTEDFTDPYFKAQDEYNGWRLKMARYVLKRTRSIRASSAQLVESLTKKYKKPTVSSLPEYFDLHKFGDAEPSFSLKTRYPQFTFVLLAAGALKEEANMRVVVDATLHILLQYPHVGLVIVGNGPRRAYLEQRAKIMGIEAQVIFEPWTDNLVSHIKTADLYLNAGTDIDAMKLMLKVAAAGLPFVSVKTDTLLTLFDGEGAGQLCPPDDVHCLSTRISGFLNNNSLRTQYATNARDIVFERLEQDYEAYKLHYRDSVEEMFLEDR